MKLDLMTALKIINVAGQVIKAGGAAAKELRAAGAKEGVTETDWDALDAQLKRIEDVARGEIEAKS